MVMPRHVREILFGGVIVDTGVIGIWLWFPGPLGLCAAWFPGIDLSRDFERAKVPGSPMKSPFFSWCLLGVNFLQSLFARVDSRIT
jgi:hypothetical protein